MFFAVELVLLVCGLWLNLTCLLQVVMNLHSRVCGNIAVDKKTLLCVMRKALTSSFCLDL